MSHPSPPLILIVEDDDAIAQLLSILFRQFGFRSLIVSDGGTVPAMLKLLQFHVITLDLNLPELSGQHILAHIRATEHTRSLPVIIVSAQSPDDTTRALANAVIGKPFDALELVTVVKELLAALPALDANEVGS